MSSATLLRMSLCPQGTNTEDITLIFTSQKHNPPVYIPKNTHDKQKHSLNDKNYNERNIPPGWLTFVALFFNLTLSSVGKDISMKPS